MATGKNPMNYQPPSNWKEYMANKQTKLREQFREDILEGFGFSPLDTVLVMRLTIGIGLRNIVSRIFSAI
jgi:hypothetical protein